MHKQRMHKREFIHNIQWARNVDSWNGARITLQCTTQQIKQQKTRERQKRDEKKIESCNMVILNEKHTQSQAMMG